MGRVEGIFSHEGTEARRGIFTTKDTKDTKGGGDYEL
jgi:hypothetical protein